ncbi:cyclic nucleotide-binding domain-containing protein [Halobacteriovorax sp. GFR7]|uniref:cyclic nucleotide-binding domain-containing protein n=1 Tax=unclassified Halobacteriovorax TaxID=2639665 RepID=UPI003D95B49E
MKNIKQLLEDSQFFKSLPEEYIELVAGCGSNIQKKSGDFLFKEGESANEFYLIRHGKVALELVAPGVRPLCIETLDTGELIGWSWIFPPYTWSYDGRCIEDCRLIKIDGRCLREKFEKNNALGYTFMKSFAQVMTSRLACVRLQLLNLYGEKN